MRSQMANTSLDDGLGDGMSVHCTRQERPPKWQMRCTNITLLVVLAICESRWSRSGQVNTSNWGAAGLLSGHEDEQHAHVEGMIFMLRKSTAKKRPSVGRRKSSIAKEITMARFNSKGRKVIIINCYAPTNTAVDSQKEEYYSSLQGVLRLEHTPRQ